MYEITTKNSNILKILQYSFLIWIKLYTWIDKEQIDGLFGSELSKLAKFQPMQTQVSKTIKILKMKILSWFVTRKTFYQSQFKETFCFYTSSSIHEPCQNSLLSAHIRARYENLHFMTGTLQPLIWYFTLFFDLAFPLYSFLQLNQVLFFSISP